MNINKDPANKQDDDIVEARVNRALTDSVQSLSPEVRRRLNQARLACESPKLKRHSLIKWSLATSMVVAIAVITTLPKPESEPSIEPFAEVLEEDLQMLEDLEFIYWVAEEKQLAKL
ncbi:hypothetical protein [Pleionea mediterranea]|uniref:DUF3619 family protein n=1 Tax=Pleionea mediterranea TaxID=523701 RepID=A0A316FWY2_9GAMM|nr:hypothetical protein [Pleionea mediterranea]PWK53069.1 hypothetical protein C8D97_104287 [Pleionea mediterranea]